MPDGRVTKFTLSKEQNSQEMSNGGRLPLQVCQLAFYSVGQRFATFHNDLILSETDTVNFLVMNTHKTSMLNNLHSQAWAHKIFIIRTEKMWNFRTFFRTSESQKTCFFVILVAYNFGTFRAEAKITIRRHEVVYRLSSERKMVDLEWLQHAILMLKSGTTLLSLCPVLLTHK